jgi:hypothetical protein
MTPYGGLARAVRIPYRFDSLDWCALLLAATILLYGLVKRGCSSSMSALPPSPADDALNTFQSAYGRLCCLAVQATEAGHDPASIGRVAAGLDRPRRGPLAALYRQHLLTSQALHEANALGVTLDQCAEAGVASRVAIESEWDCEVLIGAPS